jgi:hypothetical protein
MSGLYDWTIAEELARSSAPVDALIMAAVLRADSRNLERLRAGFPALVAEAQARYDAPGGRLLEERSSL